MLLTISVYLSFLCSIILIIVYCCNPKWRTLHNFISINQIVMGTVHLFCVNTVFENRFVDTFVSYLTQYALFATVCWSLSASLLAYVKLVLVHYGKVSYEKRKVAVFSYGCVLILKGIPSFVIRLIYGLEMTRDLLVLMSLNLIVTVNVFVVIRVSVSVLSCCKKRVGRLKSTRIISLIGIAIVCDCITLVTIIFSSLEMLRLFDITGILFIVFSYRLLPHTVVVLFNRTSLEYWKKLWRKRNMRANIRIV